MRWIAASSASWPVTTGNGSTFAALNAEIAPLAVPSFAAYTPTMSSPYCAIWPATHSCALSGLQSGVSYSASTS